MARTHRRAQTGDPGRSRPHVRDLIRAADRAEVMGRGSRIIAALLAATLGGGGGAAAQDTMPSRVSADTVISASMLSGASRPGVMVDATVAVDLGRGLTAIARPWAWRRPNAT